MRGIGRQLEFTIRSHGGRRAGAGRKRQSPRANVPHRPREPHATHCPVHVTLRAVALPASLRAEQVYPAVRGALARASTTTFRVLQFSVQHDHVHLIVEADNAATRTRGIQGLAIRAARAVNRVLGRRGAVWADRHHARLLASPRAVRHALVYVLQNFRKHGHHDAGTDPCSSARWFSGWQGVAARVSGAAPVVAARTWLARQGWRRWGLLRSDERPADAPMSRRRTRR
jgi:REP element-mobilizing transposase RayT